MSALFGGLVAAGVAFPECVPSPESSNFGNGPDRGRYRLGVRTPDSQSGNPGSIPGTATTVPSATCPFFCPLPSPACAVWQRCGEAKTRQRNTDQAITIRQITIRMPRICFGDEQENQV